MFVDIWLGQYKYCIGPFSISWKIHFRSKMNFCEDPALIRERREAAYRSRRPQQQNQKRADVVGKPKGQGQDQSVLKAREKKNTQKSAKGNHNRRGGAQWKRSRGMIPSWSTNFFIILSEYLFSFINVY